jgi:hypothetical protein
MNAIWLVLVSECYEIKEQEQLIRTLPPRFALLGLKRYGMTKLHMVYQEFCTATPIAMVFTRRRDVAFSVRMVYAVDPMVML